MVTMVHFPNGVIPSVQIQFLILPIQINQILLQVSKQYFAHQHYVGRAQKCLLRIKISLLNEIGWGRGKLWISNIRDFVRNEPYTLGVRIDYRYGHASYGRTPKKVEVLHIFGSLYLQTLIELIIFCVLSWFQYQIKGKIQEYKSRQ